MFNSKIETSVMPARFRRSRRFILMLAGTAMLSCAFVSVAGADLKVTLGNGSGARCHLEESKGGGPDNTVPDGTVTTITVADPASQTWKTVTNTCQNGQWVTTMETTRVLLRAPALSIAPVRSASPVVPPSKTKTSPVVSRIPS